MVSRSWRRRPRSPPPHTGHGAEHRRRAPWRPIPWDWGARSSEGSIPSALPQLRAKNVSVAAGSLRRVAPRRPRTAPHPVPYAQWVRLARRRSSASPLASTSRPLDRLRRGGARSAIPKLHLRHLKRGNGGSPYRPRSDPLRDRRRDITKGQDQYLPNETSAGPRPCRNGRSPLDRALFDGSRCGRNRHR